jgi:threonine dehydratase
MTVGVGATTANAFAGIPPLGTADVKAAAARISQHVRPVTLLAADLDPFDRTGVYLACEGTQVTGSFEARGAANFALYHLEQDAMPDAGVVIAVSGNGNSGIACAWAAREAGSPALVYVPSDCPWQVVRSLHDLGAHVRRVDGDADDADRAAAKQAERIGALLSQPGDEPLVAAGAGTLAMEVNELIGAEIDTVVVPAGDGALLAGACAALENTGIGIVPVEPQRRRTLSVAMEAGFPVRVSGGTVADDSFGARRISQLGLDLARDSGCRPVQVTDDEIARARRTLWEERRIPSEYGAAAAFAAIQSGAYTPDLFERVVVVITGANTDASSLAPA